MSVMPRLASAAWKSGSALTASSHSKNSSSMIEGWTPGMCSHRVTALSVSETTAS